MEEKKPIDSESTETKYVQDPYADIDAKNDGEDYEEYEEEEYIPPNPFEEKTSLTEVKYSIHLDEYDSAFLSFQKKYVYPKNIIMSAAFVIIAALYGQQLYMDPTDTLRWFLFIMCFLLIGGMWFNTRKVRKKLMKSIKEIKDDTYTTKLYDTGISILVNTSEEEGIYPTYITFAEDNPIVMDKENMFILYLRKKMFYVIPKKDMSDSDKKLFAETFAEKLDKDYIRK